MTQWEKNGQQKRFHNGTFALERGLSSMLILKP